MESWHRDSGRDESTGWSISARENCKVGSPVPSVPSQTAPDSSHSSRRIELHLYDACPW